LQSHTGEDGSVPRNEFEDDSEERGRSAVAVETLRSASTTSRNDLEPRSPQQAEERVSLFWRIFGGTILSVVALGAITLYNNLSSSISELRAELGRERDARGELVKKDEFQSRNQSQYERIRAAEGLKADLEGLKERMNANATAVDSMKKDTSGLEVLKERAATLAADLKTAREDVHKLQQELDKNRTADLERKAARDTQTKQQEDAIKELQKDLQSCRLKLAKLEGQLPMLQPMPTAKPLVGPVVPRDDSDED
jgi:DNA repair exonuclease SbcCD ATPase subunit